MHLIVALVGAVLIAGCSSRVFEKETAGFRDAATGVETAWIGLYDKLDALEQAEQDRIREDWKFFSRTKQCAKLVRVLAVPPKVDLDEAPRKAALKSRRELVEDCTLFGRQTDKSKPKEVFVKPEDRQLLPYAKAISDYAAALAALAAAEDEAAFRTAAAESGASLGTASDALKEFGGSDFDLAGPISALASIHAEIRLAGIERRKYNTLRYVVEETDRAIQHMTKKLAEAEVPLRRKLLQAQYDAIRNAEKDLSDSLRAEEELRNLLRAAEDLRNSQGAEEKLAKAEALLWRKLLQAQYDAIRNAERVKRQQAVIDRLLEYRAYARTLVPGGVSYAAVGEAHTQLLNAVRSPDDFHLARLAVERLTSIGEAAKEAAAALGLKD